MINLRKAALTIATVSGCLVLAMIGSGRAQGQVLIDSGEGWINSITGPNGNAMGGDYTAGGKSTSGNFRNHFDFGIPTLAGPLLTATLQLTERAGGDLKGHTGADTTYAVYSLGAYGTYGFSDIGTGTAYGNTGLSAADNGTSIDIPLDVSAISTISGLQGSTFSLGGVDSGEGASAPNFDFGFTTGLDAELILTVGPAISPSGTPEPGSTAFVFGMCVFLAMAMRKRIRRF